MNKAIWAFALNEYEIHCTALREQKNKMATQAQLLSKLQPGDVFSLPMRGGSTRWASGPAVGTGPIEVTRIWSHAGKTCRIERVRFLFDEIEPDALNFNVIGRVLLKDGGDSQYTARFTHRVRLS